MASYSTQEWVFNAFGASLMHQSAQAVPKLPINCLYNTEGLIHTYWMNEAIWLLCSICCWKTTTLGNPIVRQTAELLKFPDPRFFDRITAEGRTIGHARSTHTHRADSQNLLRYQHDINSEIEIESSAASAITSLRNFESLPCVCVNLVWPIDLPSAVSKVST